MDEQTLRVFLTLCETENTRDAAAALRVNQSNVSRAIARLEAELGTELFTRHGRRISLNRAGAAFRPDAAEIVERYEIGRRHLSQVTGPATSIRLGFLQSTARWAVPVLVGGFRDIAPGSRFELRQGFSRELFSWIADDALDVAFSTPPARSDLAWTPMVEQRLCVAVPRGHRLAARASITPADLDGEDFVAFSRTTEIRTVIDPMLQEAGAQVRIAFESSEVDTIRGLVGVGLGVAILPEPSQMDAAEPMHIPLVPAHARRLGVAWSAERTNPASVRAFLEHCRGLDLGV
ncbi:LysR family transcriptional regulator [Propionicicella superfundia]|uniref:LysR family transcriptional regulator n=1 Tax=Propionicicella superfundia TaxID=348582 RepID=UPI000A03AE92|nr:LysR family transcriptional regulator [Propionicicella superfundia]